MSLPSGELSGSVRLGEGVAVEQVRLMPVRDVLKNGSFVIDDAQGYIREALIDPAITKADALAAMNLPANKTFRNAYISILMERIWPVYKALATGDDMGLYKLSFDGSDAILDRLPPGATSKLAVSEIADLVASSNQAMATYCACRLFRDGNIPEICGDTEKDWEYFNAFFEQTELQIKHTDKYFQTIPPYMGSPSRFVSSGLQVLRTHLFGVPNLVDSVAANEDTVLSPTQHRIGVTNTISKSITPFYIPTGPLIIAFNKLTADPEDGTLLPDSWMSNGDPDSYLVYPKPAIVQGVNETVAQFGNLPVQTNCPVFHSRVVTAEAAGTMRSLPQALAQLAFRQLDVLYYPQRQRVWDLSNK